MSEVLMQEIKICNNSYICLINNCRALGLFIYPSELKRNTCRQVYFKKVPQRITKYVAYNYFPAVTKGFLSRITHLYLLFSYKLHMTYI